MISNNKNISFLNDKESIEHCYILGESNDLLDYFIPEKFYIHNLKQLRKIKDDYKLIITNSDVHSDGFRKPNTARRWLISNCRPQGVRDLEP